MIYFAVGDTEMPLDLTRVVAQIEGMAATLQAEEQERGQRLSHALETLRHQSADLDSLKKKIARRKTSWLVAGIADGLVDRHVPPPCPSDFAVIATDGSQIDVDRQSAARCCLINVGSIILRYGLSPDAVLRSQPTLYAGYEELTIADPSSSSEQPVQGALLGIKRAVAECLVLAELGEELPPQLPALALLDGTLILWGLAGKAYDEYVKRELLDNGFLMALDRINGVSQKTGLALASYISSTGSTEVVNTLRVAVCPHETPDCDRHCSGRAAPSKRECDAVAGLRDRHLFSALLEPGERSATFLSLSSVVQDSYKEHEVRFFYLKVEDEIARVEFPRWVEERGLVDFVHTIVLDQCRRGHGYPPALSEAHEQAVLTGADREQFQRLVELALTNRRLSATTSAKSRSKRSRWV
ncbi:MAG: DNA double-strand break repair nuclease NurA [Dehalococcoidia bacterium]